MMIPSHDPLVLRCPLCDGADGDIRVRSDAFYSWDPASGIGGTVRVDSRPEQPVLLFGSAGRRSVRPCPHMIACYVDLYLCDHRGVIDRSTEMTLDWDHPWFSRPLYSDDDRSMVHCAFYESDTLVTGVVDTLVDRWIEHKSPWTHGRVFAASGRALLAPDPEASLDRLLARHVALGAKAAEDEP